MSERIIRILLIYPPSRTQSHKEFPMGILMLAAVLHKAGHEVHLLDANAVNKRRTTEEIVEFANELKPDVIGMTLLTPLVVESYRLASYLRGNGSKLIAGGPHATILSEEVISHGFDAVVLGEGEATIEEAAKALLGHMPKDDVKGWVYRNNSGKAVRTEARPLIDNLDELPMPVHHMVNDADYGAPENSSAHSNLFTSRGCSSKCAFCSGWLFGKRFRFRSAQNILDEMCHLYNTYGTKQFSFLDDAMTIDRERVKELCNGLIRSKMPVKWSAMTRVDKIDEELLKLMASAGCQRLDFGIESGNPETLKRFHKPHTVELVRRIVPMTAKMGIKSVLFFIVGSPWEDIEAIRKTHSLMSELSPYTLRFHPAIASILIPFPGTEIYEKYKDRYNLENWWLIADRRYDAPRQHTHPYFSCQLFPYGAVLDADFFYYTGKVKQEIIKTFEIMYIHNLRRHNLVSRFVRIALIRLSRWLHALAPGLEHLVFVPVNR